MYGRFITASAVAMGVLYSLGYVSADIREVVSDGVPMEPPLFGVAVFFCFGAALGSAVAAGVAPSTYISESTSSIATVSRFWFRLRLFSIAAFLIAITVIVLYLAFSHD